MLQVKVKTFIASEIGAKLDSNVITGGGTDDTAVLQAVLDEAQNYGVHLIIDGAALITGLKLYSNTTIECLNKDCGFFLADQTNGPLLRNAHMNFKAIYDKNISIISGTYNHNCQNQKHDIPVQESIYADMAADMENAFGNTSWTRGFDFFGVEDLTISGITLRDQRTFGMLIANWKHVKMENILIDLPHHLDAQNQDGIHFWGPGQFLSMHNIRGTVGDDFIALAPDEYDKKSDITDVLIDGVCLDNADQGIRMLSRGTGRLDRVTIKNVTGTYKSYGFYINPWFPDETYGNVGTVVFENIDLRQVSANYDYTSPFLFRLGGNIESVIFRNIIHHNAMDSRALFEIGVPFYDMSYKHPTGLAPVIDSIVIDGLHIAEEAKDAKNCEYIQLFGYVNHMVLRNIDIIRDNKDEPAGCIINCKSDCEIETLILNNIYSSELDSFIRAHNGKIHTLMISNTLSRNLKNEFADISKGVVDKYYCTDMF